MAKKTKLKSSLTAESVEKEIIKRYPLSGIVREYMGPTADDYRAEGFRDAIEWLIWGNIDELNKEK